MESFQSLTVESIFSDESRITEIYEKFPDLEKDLSHEILKTITEIQELEMLRNEKARILDSISQENEQFSGISLPETAAKKKPRIVALSTSPPNILKESEPVENSPINLINLLLSDFSKNYKIKKEKPEKLGFDTKDNLIFFKLSVSFNDFRANLQVAFDQLGQVKEIRRVSEKGELLTREQATHILSLCKAEDTDSLRMILENYLTTLKKETKMTK